VGSHNNHRINFSAATDHTSFVRALANLSPGLSRQTNRQQTTMSSSPAPRGGNPTSQGDAQVSTVTTRTTRSGQKASATVSNFLGPTTSTDKVTKSKRPKPSTVRSRTTPSTGGAPCKRKQPASKPGKQQASKPGKQKASKPAKDPVLGWKADKGITGDLPPIHNLKDIVTDITKKSLKYEGTMKMIQHLKNREIRVATMCSGTESPLLALEMIFDGMHCCSKMTVCSYVDNIQRSSALMAPH